MALTDYNMIQDGERVLIALSGGKDSFTLLDTLRRFQRRAPIKFSLFISIIHPGFPGFSTDKIEKWLEENKYDFYIVKSNIYKTIFNDEKKSRDGCFYCARQRRSVLYRQADIHNCQKIALGHHRDDFIETVLMSMMYNGVIETMLPVLETKSKKFKIIRPLIYVGEDIIKEYAIKKDFPLISCFCPLYNNNLRRKKIKKMLSEFEKNDPEIKGCLFRSLSNYNGDFMLDLNYNSTLKYRNR